MFPAHRNPARFNLLRNARRLMAVTAAIVLSGVPAFGQKTSSTVAEVPGVEIVSTGGEPELRVGGVPFFVHAAQFDYFRIPRDLWAPSLFRYRDLGINTIDLRIPWNWHEPQDGQFDFTGRTNPNRDLRALLGLVSQMRFKLIVRPGPVIGDHWLNAGIPAWLLARPEYKMRAENVQDGLLPPVAKLAGEDSDAAARAWLANGIHMTLARRWLTAVARVLAPYAAKNLLSVNDPGSREGESQEKKIPGPLLFVGLDDAVSVPPGAEAPDLSKYLDDLRSALAQGGLNAISFLNMPGAAVQGPASIRNASAKDDLSAMGITGQWIFDPQTSTSSRGSLLNGAEVSSLSFLARSLAAQPGFPPLISTFSATTFAPAGDTRAAQPAPENTLLASRLLLGSGIRGIVYSPLQDTLTPAGWETPSAARYFRWDAPLDLEGDKGPRANGVMRNGQFISAWGTMLAASHVKSDFGIVDLRASAQNAARIARARYAKELEQIGSVASLAGYTPEFVNPDAQPVERLLRDPVILLDVPQDVSRTIPQDFSSGAPRDVPEDVQGDFELSEHAQEVLVEYVRRGGVLVYFPARPRGARLNVLWQGAPVNHSAGDDLNTWTFGSGRVIASSSDFYSGVRPAEDLNENRVDARSSAGVKFFAALMERSGARRALRFMKSNDAGSNLIVSRLVSNDARGPVCAEEQLCAAALISITNLDPEQRAEGTLEMGEPLPTGTTSARATISFNVTVPAHDSLLLPVHAPLCSAAGAGEHCSDEIIAAGAELIRAEREGKTLELSFYTPARAAVRLRLESEPSKVEFSENYRAENEWNKESRELDVQLPRGAAPDYARTLRIHLRYKPHVMEKPDPPKDSSRGLEYEVSSAMRLPLGPDVTIPTRPPLVVTDDSSGGHMIVTTHNLTDNTRVSDFSLDGAFHGTGYVRVYADEQQITRIRFQASRPPGEDEAKAPPPHEGLASAQLAIHSGRERGTGQVLFLTANDKGDSHYQYDFDRDGSPEWVLESSRLRLIVSPAYSGRALALVDKTTNDDLITFGGGLHDFLISAGDRPEASTLTPDFAFNRGYRAKWIEGKPDTGLQLSYQERDNSPEGLHVKKTVQFLKPETIEAAYRVSGGASTPEGSEHPEVGKSFLSEMSIPVSAPEEGNTQFCWGTRQETTPTAAPSTENGGVHSHCEDFISGGEPVWAPEGVTRMEIHSPGKHPLTLEWSAGQVVIVPKTFSAQVRFVVPLPRGPETACEFTLRYTAEDGQ
jgi:Glycosyl hydrolases family 35